MEVIIDDTYEQLAAEWQFQMIDILKGTLHKHGIDIKTSKLICGDFAFDLSMLQDQGQIMLEEEEYRPVICFDNMNGKLKYNSNEEVQLHEYALGNTDEAFEH